MAVYKQAGSKNWWFKFTFNGEMIRESTKQTNKRVAEQIEAARKTGLAKGDVGIREKVRVPTLKEFAEAEFLPYLKTRCADKPRTLKYYQHGLYHLTAHAPLANAALDEITVHLITGFIQKQQGKALSITSINRHLQVLRRLVKLGTEWGRSQKAPPRVSMLPGEHRRDRVLSPDEETRYLRAVRDIGESVLESYRQALKGIRAVVRGEVPLKPADAFVLLHFATLLIECGIRPDEAYRLRWDEVRNGAIYIGHGKTASARRMVPLSPAAASILEMRETAGLSPEWVFPAPTASGHIEQSTVRKRHAEACKLAKIEHFPPYTIRHTTLTRWAAVLDPYILAQVAGHADFATTRRYVHPRQETVLAAMEKAREVQGGHRIGHSEERIPHLPSADSRPTN